MPNTRLSFLLIALSVTLVGALASAQPLFAADQEKVLKYFGGKIDGRRNGSNPSGGLIFDAAGNLYGTTQEGGLIQCGYDGGCGTVFELTRQADGSWKETVLYRFTGRDAGGPAAGLVFDGAGNLYGTATGCNIDGCIDGPVFELERQADGTWKYKRLYHAPQPGGPLIFDQAGDLYGTAFGVVGDPYWGSVFELTPGPNGKWTSKILHRFSPYANGKWPVGGLTIDAAGNLYGVTCCGGSYVGRCSDSQGCGVVFELTPQAVGKWKEIVLHRFNGKDGFNSAAGLTSDAQGNLYGTSGGGLQSCQGYYCGVVFELVRPQTGGKWKEKVLHNFHFSDGWGPESNLTFDSAGNLYGTTFAGGGPCFDPRGCGTAFELMPTQNGEWSEKVLFKFRGGDGAYPSSDLIFDSSGNLYGETYSDDGSAGPGVVFEITP